MYLYNPSSSPAQRCSPRIPWTILSGVITYCYYSYVYCIIIIIIMMMMIMIIIIVIIIMINARTRALRVAV